MIFKKKVYVLYFKFFLEPEPFKIEPIPRGATGSSVSDPYSLNPDPAKKKKCNIIS